MNHKRFAEPDLLKLCTMKRVLDEWVPMHCFFIQPYFPCSCGWSKPTNNSTHTHGSSVFDSNYRYAWTTLLGRAWASPTLDDDVYCFFCVRACLHTGEAWLGTRAIIRDKVGTSPTAGVKLGASARWIGYELEYTWNFDCMHASCSPDHVGSSTPFSFPTLEVSL